MDAMGATEISTNISEHGQGRFIDDLVRARLGVHTEMRGGIEVTAGIGEEVLRWLAARMRRGMSTAEVGCGLTTAVFAAAGTTHVCVSPVPDEHQRVAAWCVSQGIPMTQVRFIASRSDHALPTLGLTNLDLVLIDGSHAFPHAFIDYWYLAVPLKQGGLIVIDDIQIWTGQVLYDFLCEQPGWELVQEWGKAAAFRKTAPLEELGAWTRQPYVLERSVPIGAPGLRGYASLVKHRKYRWATERARRFATKKVNLAARKL